ncbi:sulfotransferase domain-containing protein [Labrenzia sp. PHM005]|uniref:sulfotransferase domain-containing protein n=1 Tax=Labrenzia sp. PHM005 TaxID=2590016 RepID=UPI0011404166|nr:sulfotransferase domain-containing protein [Labrenzia sp. PHM005]QDG76855.1 sulfotransferase domain-containing protein [Labrenzia sp. PHM005]
MHTFYTRLRTARKIRNKTRQITQHMKDLSDNGWTDPIVVAGYPKSGNTWLCRLVAEILDCPVGGYAGLPDPNEIAIEGEERKSRQYVLKSHHVLPTLDRLSHPNLKILCVVRDPRDVAVSGMHYCFEGHTDASSQMLATMMEDQKGHYWKYRSWSSYVDEFRAAGFPTARYEDLLWAPEATVTELLTKAGLSFDPARVSAAIENQSFAKAKARYVSNGEDDKIRHMRQGKRGSYKDELSQAEIQRLTRALAPTMVDLGYLS